MVHSAPMIRNTHFSVRVDTFFKEPEIVRVLGRFLIKLIRVSQRDKKYQTD